MEPGDLLGGRFEIERHARRGGMGDVFRAHDRVSAQAVAIKRLSDGREHHGARFAREVALLSELQHPGIVRYISHGAMPSGELFLVMEWLEGEDLKGLLERGSLTAAESITLATRIAEALGVAHARGIVHRDLKPSNLFLPAGRIEQVKLLDFGIAHKEGLAQLTQTGTMIGTPGYVAPEQARNHGRSDARADVFALGCVLFQCLTGTPAFEGDSAIAILGKILFGDAPRVSELWADVPEDLDALVARMLSKDPALRPADGANLAAALAALEPVIPGAPATGKPRERKPSALTGGERRFLSVVLLGSTADGEPLADRQAGSPASLPADPPVEDALHRAIRPYGGRIEQFADGSTIVVLEADRQVATDQAAQAARCALAMRAFANGQPMAIAMGRADSTRKLPEGDVIDRASRLLSYTARASGDLSPIALDDVSAGLLDARFDVVESAAGLLQLHGERPLMQGARTLLGRPTSCVGRDWELTALTGILDECIEDPEARVVVVTGAAGIGKSRLGAEFVSRVQQRSAQVSIWVGRGDSLRAGSTLDLLAQALRGALGINGGEPLPERRAKIRARVAEHVPAGEHKRVAEFLGELTGAPFPDDDDGGAALRAARQDAQLMSEQMRRAWMDFLRAETAVHPVLLVLEDLHWGDFGTVRFIDMALRDRSEQPWMVLALARPEVYEVFPKLWAERQNVQEIRLKELGRKAGERLVRQVLGDTVGQDTVEHLVKQADGNTFYLEELIRAAAEGKDHALPDTVLAMVETRLGRLAIEARRVLRAASVFGEVCWDGGVVVLLGHAMGPAMVGEWLARLVEQEVLAARPASRFSGQRELAFRHSLLREGAYATLTEDDKRLGHRVAGDWLAQHGEGDPMVLAGHFERGGEGTRAASYYLRAAEQAYYHVLDIEAIMVRANLGLACAPPQELRLALLGMRCQASGGALQMINAAMPDADELLRSAPPGSVPWAQGVIAYLEGTTLAGRISDFLAAVALLRGVDPAPDAVARMSLAFLSAVCILDVLGRVPEGTTLEQRFFAFVQTAGDREPIARFWRNTATGMRAAYAHEDPWNALQHSDAIQAIFDVIGGQLIFLNMELFRGMNLWFLGALTPAEQKLETIAAADESLGVASSLRRFSLAWLRADRGALDEARVLAAQLSEYGHAHHNPLDEGRGCWVLAEVLRRMGDLDAAEREIAAALGMAMPLEHPGILGTLSALRLAQGRPSEALAAAEDAVARCAAMGGCGMFRGAFVRLAHAEALHATGAHDAARHAIVGARARLFAIAGRIADRDYKQSFLDNVPENARTLALARAWLGEATPTVHH
jgi:eukaryotic-like serine/threonine-protein kinase